MPLSSPLYLGRARDAEMGAEMHGCPDDGELGEENSEFDDEDDS